MSFVELLQALLKRFRTITVQKVGDWIIPVPAYESRLRLVQAFMDKMHQMEKHKDTQHMQVDTDLRMLMEDLFLGAVEAIDSCIQAKKPVKHRDGIRWVPQVRIQRQGEILFEKLMAFTDTPAGVFFMDVAFPGYAER